MRRPQLRSTFARAVVPVAAGLGFFAVLGLLLWGVASLISHNGKDTSTNFTPTVQEMGPASAVQTVIQSDGPIVLQDLIGNDRHIVLDYTDADGFAVYLAHPADRTFACTIEVVKHTHTFKDCEGRIIGVDQLALPPKGVSAIVNADGSLTLDLTADRPAGSGTTTT